jgi:hypothetical protein
MSPRYRALLVATALLALSACVSSTTFTSTWKAPDVSGLSPVGKTIAAVFVSRDESQRRAGEDALVAQINAHGGHGIPSYTIIPTSEHLDADSARQRLKQAGANASLVMRVVGKDQQISYTPGGPTPLYYGGFGPYWGYGWGLAYDPGYLRTDTIVSVETLLYSLDRDKLLWASQSRTANPNDLPTRANEVATATAREREKQGLLASQ